MKNIILSIFIGLAAIFSACNPIEDRYELGAKLPADQINVTVTSIDGSNKLVLKNNDPSIGGSWDYKFGVSTKTIDTVVVPVVGTYDVTYIATTDGGLVYKDVPVTIDEMSYPVPGYSELTGNGAGKVWVYDTSDGLYSYLGPGDPAKWESKWWNPNSQDYINCELTFALDGANTVYKLSNEGTEEVGSFLIDMPNNKLTIVNAHMPDWTFSGDETGVYTISVLTDTFMVLYQKRPNAGGGWFWRFVPKDLAE
ncbi:MAG: hypothetical protein GXO47_11220 [Chlorobi bacterium]|nr:hypothetical protein [Chlorobiota bacterium]